MLGPSFNCLSVLGVARVTGATIRGSPMGWCVADDEAVPDCMQPTAGVSIHELVGLSGAWRAVQWTEV